jgi:hypothetical protein
MAKKASEATNTPDSEDVQRAVREIEDRYIELASRKGSYMLECRHIREAMARDYDRASERGISKKLLRLIIKERELERRIDGLAVDLEHDERSELEMLMEKLGDFASTELGLAAVAKVNLAPPAAQ